MVRTLHSLTRKIILWIVLGIVVWIVGLAWFIEQIPNREDNITEIATDVIVVLTGGSGRLEHGLELLAEGKGKKLFISGVGGGATVEDVLRQAPDELRGATKWITGSIVLGVAAENTIGNAEETACWVKKEGYSSIRLVTADYHIPRASLELSQTLPGATIIPDAVFTDDYSPPTWWQGKESRARILAEYHKFLAGKLRHYIVKISGKDNNFKCLNSVK